jgi:hypothetical protein
MVRRLLPPGMKLALARIARERPIFFFFRIGRAHRRRYPRRPGTPIFRRMLYSPHVTRLIESNSDQPHLARCSQRDAVSDLRHHAANARQSVELHRCPRLHFSRQPHAAALRVHHQGLTLVHKRMCRIETGNPNRNFPANASASALDFGRLNCGFHVGLYPILRWKAPLSGWL